MMNYNTSPNDLNRIPVSEEAQLEDVIQGLNLSGEDAEALRSMTRLLVGGALIGWDELLAHLQLWEQEVKHYRAQQEALAPGDETESTPTVMRYALLGLLFESQDRWIRRSRSILNLVGRATEAVFSPAMQRADQSRLARPARTRLERLVSRGERVSSRWVERGRVEEAHGRRLVQIALENSFNTTMDQLGEAPALQQLVRKQSAGLSQDALDEVRKRTVTGDMVAEHFARRLLRRAPRSELTESSPVSDQNREELDQD